MLYNGYSGSWLSDYKLLSSAYLIPPSASLVFISESYLTQDWNSLQTGDMALGFRVDFDKQTKPDIIVMNRSKANLILNQNENNI